MTGLQNKDIVLAAYQDKLKPLRFSGFIKIIPSWANTYPVPHKAHLFLTWCKAKHPQSVN